jgi:hypothetical protein
MDYYLYSKPILKGLAEADITNYYKLLVKQYFESNPRSEQPLLVQWIFLKILYAEKVKKRITYNDYAYGISCFEDKDRNRINDSLQFSLGNCICGQLAKKGLYNNDSIPEIRYTNDSLWIEDKHEEIVALDTPIGNLLLKKNLKIEKKSPLNSQKLKK